MPQEDDRLKGHKYPFNACEILCSENGFIIEKIMEMIRIHEDSDSDSDDSDSEKKKKKIKKRRMEDSENELEDQTQTIEKSLENLTIEPEHESEKKENSLDINESEEVKKPYNTRNKVYEQIQINDEEHDHSLSLSTEIKKQIKKEENVIIYNSRKNILVKI
jgi:hypothetical protein